MHYINHYVIDWDKVETLDEVKEILKCLQISFEPNHLDISRLEKFVRLEPKPVSVFTVN